jgi:hypothetical protein
VIHTHFSQRLDGRPDRLSIHGIGFVAQQEGFDMLGWEHFDLMPQRHESACPVMRAPTSLHCNKAFLTLGEEIGELGTFDLAALDFAGIHVDDVKLKHRLGQIQSNYGQLCCKFHDEPPDRSGYVEPPLWHTDAVSARPHLTAGLPHFSCNAAQVGGTGHLLSMIVVDGSGHSAENRERPLYCLELDRQIPDFRVHPLSALKSRTAVRLE